MPHAERMRMAASGSRMRSDHLVQPGLADGLNPRNGSRLGRDTTLRPPPGTRTRGQHPMRLIKAGGQKQRLCGSVCRLGPQRPLDARPRLRHQPTQGGARFCGGQPGVRRVQGRPRHLQ